MKKARTAGPSSPFRVVVPNRVDIAGGTLDIYPLYLLVGDAMTVNAAIAVRSEVAVRPFRRGAARLVSGNFGIAATAADTHGFSLGGKMGLLSRALRHFPAVSGVEIRVRNEAPVGSGHRRVVRPAGRPDAGGRKADRDRVPQGRDRPGGDGDRGGPPEEPDRPAGPHGGAARRPPGDPVFPRARRRAFGSPPGGGRGRCCGTTRSSPTRESPTTRRT